MADDLLVRDGAGNQQTLAATDVDGRLLPRHIVADPATGEGLSPATEAKQDELIAKDFATQTTLAAVLEKIIAAPATEAKQDTAIAGQATIGTRAYGTGARVAVGSGSTQSSAITATEVLLHASVKCYVKAGSAPTAVANGDSIPLEAGEKFHMRITSGHKIAVIRDSADGYLHIVPVV